MGWCTPVGLVGALGCFFPAQQAQQQHRMPKVLKKKSLKNPPKIFGGKFYSNFSNYFLYLCFK